MLYTDCRAVSYTVANTRAAFIMQRCMKHAPAELAGRRLPSRASTAFKGTARHTVRPASRNKTAGATAYSDHEPILTARPAGTGHEESTPAASQGFVPAWPPRWAEAPSVSSLPIARDVPRILSALQHGSNLVLEAPPGAGKTTLLPLALLEGAGDWLQPTASILVGIARELWRIARPNFKHPLKQ